jgi:hypothetical protein
MATKWGAKTAIGDAAAQESWDKNWMKNESKKATSDRVRQARDEADAEVKRETRGSTTSPMDQFMGELDKGFKDKGLDTTREGNNVTIKGVKKPKEDSMTPGQKQSMQDAKDAAMQSKKDKAYNAAKTYPDDYAKGGMTASSRADGIAQRGKTRGTLIK